MKKIFMLCMAGAIALTASSCGDDDEGGGNSGKMTVNGRTEKIKSAFYQEYAGNEGLEAEFDLYLLKDAFSQVPTEDPSFYVNVDFTESFLGKTVDLTKPLDQSKRPEPDLYIMGVIDGRSFSIEYDNSEINHEVTAGTLTATKNGDYFTIKLSVTLADGNSIDVDWAGTATKVVSPD